MFDYKEYINKHSHEFGSCPFWSWNDKLEDDELCRQIDDMKKQGMTGFFMHARGGLKTEYFSEEWFHAIKTCVDYAKKQGMQAWLYDENGWPSGFANRELLDDESNLSSYLEMERAEEFPNIIEDFPYTSGVIAVFYMQDGKPRRLFEANDSKEYILIKRKFEGSYVDTLKESIAKQFLERVYEEYKKRFPESLGTEFMPGFFTDEPQYFRYATPWSNVLPEAFQNKYGYDVLEALPALFLEYDGACEKRYDYWSLLHELFMENWIRPIYEWCEEHGCKLTGHAIEESSLFTQMWCCGGVMPFYEYEHIPGVDHLGRQVDPGLEAKQVGSVAAQLGKKRVLAEIFACSGYDVTLQELKGIGDSMYVDGVNFICQHLYPYSSCGERKYDHPTHFSDISPWHKHMKVMNDYYNRLGCLLSLGEDATNVLVLHPMHSAYLYFRREEDRQSIATLETAFTSCLKELWSKHILFHLGDETIIKKHGSIEDSRFVVGNCKYDVVIMPDMDTIDSSTVALLEQYIQNGGKLLCMGRTPKFLDGRRYELHYESNIDLYTIKSEQDLQVDFYGNNPNMLKYSVRNHQGNKIVFLTNLTDETMRKITIPGLKNPMQLNLSDMSFSGNTTRDSKCEISLEPYESCVLIEQTEVVHENVATQDNVKKRNIDSCYQLELPTENYLVLDYAKVSFNGRDYSERKPIPLISQEILEKRHQGNVWLQFEYHVSGNTEQLHLIVEPQVYREIAVNGTVLRDRENDWRIDRRFLMYDICEKSRLGINTIDLCFDYWQKEEVYNTYFGNGTESLRNCMSFVTEIEPIYLMGNFEVQAVGTGFWQEEGTFCHTGEFSLKWQNPTLDATNVTVNGYPFFYGKMKLKQSIIANKDTYAICVEGRYGACEVWMNGELAGICVLGNKVDISSVVIEGENNLELVVYSSARNLLGPFHYETAEPISVFPTVFTYENQWHNGVCEKFRERYAFVPFGVQAYLLDRE